MTYAAPLKVIIRLTIFDKDPGDRRQDHSRHQGAGSLLRRNPADDRERHVHHQRNRARHRQPVAPQSRRVLRIHAGKSYFLGKIIPYRGSWVEFEYETAKNILYVRIDRKRKFLATIFLRALGLKTRRRNHPRLLQDRPDHDRRQEAVLERFGQHPGIEGFQGHRQSEDEGSAASTPARRSRQVRLQPYQAGEGRAVRSDPGGSRRRFCRRRRRRYEHRRSYCRNQQRTDADA